MQQHIKTLLKDNLYLFAILITLGIAGLSLIKMPNTTIEIKQIDKAYHAFAYFVLGLSWLFAFYKKPQKKYIIVLGCIFFGIVIEVLQGTLTVYRTGDLLDVFANSFGVILALFVFLFYSRKK